MFYIYAMSYAGWKLTNVCCCTKKTQNVFDESCREGPVSGTANNYISQYLLLKCANYFFLFWLK